MKMKVTINEINKWVFPYLYRYHSWVGILQLHDKRSRAFTKVIGFVTVCKIGPLSHL